MEKHLYVLVKVFFTVCCYLVITATVVIIALAIVSLTIASLVTTTIVPTFVTALILAATMLLLITRGVLTVVPVISHKVDPLTTGIVLTAMLAPMFCMARRYAKIDWFSIHRYPLDHHRLTINHLWLWVTANVQPAIKTRLANANRHANVGSKYWSVKGGSRDCDCHH